MVQVLHRSYDDAESTSIMQEKLLLLQAYTNRVGASQPHAQIRLHTASLMPLYELNHASVFGRLRGRFQARLAPICLPSNFIYFFSDVFSSTKRSLARNAGSTTKKLYFYAESTWLKNHLHVRCHEMWCYL